MIWGCSLGALRSQRIPEKVVWQWQKVPILLSWAVLPFVDEWGKNTIPKSAFTLGYHIYPEYPFPGLWDQCFWLCSRKCMYFFLCSISDETKQWGEHTVMRFPTETQTQPGGEANDQVELWMVLVKFFFRTHFFRIIRTRVNEWVPVHPPRILAEVYLIFWYSWN